MSSSRVGLNIALIVTCLVFAAVAAAAGGSGESDASLSVGLIQWPGYAHTYLASELGMFERQGVAVEIRMYDSNPEMHAAFRSGEIDALFTLVPDLLVMYAEGIQPIAVAIADVSVSGDVVVARPPVREPRDLAGRTIAFEGLNSFSHLFVLELIRGAGLDESEVTLRNVSGNDVPAALSRGEIDAGHTWEPFLTEALAAGNEVIATAADVPPFIIDVLVTTRRTLEAKREAFVALVAALDEALAYSQGANRQEAVRVMARSEGMARKTMEDGLATIRQPLGDEALQMMSLASSEGSLAAAIELVSGIFLERGQLTTLPRADELVDASVLTDALARSR